MRLVKLYPQEMQVLQTTDLNQVFQWKVGLTYIQSRKNKFEILPPSREKLI